MKRLLAIALLLLPSVAYSHFDDRILIRENDSGVITQVKEIQVQDQFNLDVFQAEAIQLGRTDLLTRGTGDSGGVYTWGPFFQGQGYECIETTFPPHYTTERLLQYNNPNQGNGKIIGLPDPGLTVAPPFTSGIDSFGNLSSRPYIYSTFSALLDDGPRRTGIWTYSRQGCGDPGDNGQAWTFPRTDERAFRITFAVTGRRSNSDCSFEFANEGRRVHLEWYNKSGQLVGHQDLIKWLLKRDVGADGEDSCLITLSFVSTVDVAGFTIWPQDMDMLMVHDVSVGIAMPTPEPEPVPTPDPIPTPDPTPDPCPVPDTTELDQCKVDLGITRADLTQQVDKLLDIQGVLDR